MVLYILDLAGVAVFAASGALAAISAQLDLLGILVLASITAVGGGTVRDLLMNRHPIFWMQDSKPLLVIIFATALTVAWTQFLPIPHNALLIADALGLAVFAMTGAQLAEAANCRRLVVILMGTLTGTGGGMIRDVLTAKVPLILRADIYASAAILGIGVYLMLRAVKVPTPAAFAVGFVVIAGTRLVAIAFDLRLPVVTLPAQ